MRENKNEQGSLMLMLLTGVGLLGILWILYFMQALNKQNPQSYQRVVSTTKDSLIKSDISQLEIALNLYKLQEQKYPNTLEDLKKTGYIQSVPKNPYNNSDYNYSSNGISYTIETKLGDGSVYVEAEE